MRLAYLKSTAIIKPTNKRYNSTILLSFHQKNAKIKIQNKCPSFVKWVGFRDLKTFLSPPSSMNGYENDRISREMLRRMASFTRLFAFTIIVYLI